MNNAEGLETPEWQKKFDKPLFESQFWRLVLAWLGVAEAQFQLAVLYDNGVGVEKNLQKAAQWFRKAANQGHVLAQYSLSVCYDTGSGVEKDAAKAFEWCMKSAKKGFAQAQYNVGVCYRNGDGVDMNIEKAAEWYQKAAEQGHGVAHNAFSRLLSELGNGIFLVKDGRAHARAFLVKETLSNGQMAVRIVTQQIDVPVHQASRATK